MAKKSAVKKRSEPAKKSRKRAAKSSSTQPPAEGGARAVASARGFVRIYRHGLGDCILIRIPRANRPEYKILIDCGVAVATLNAPAKMKEVLEDVMALTGGEVDVLAVTHEHWDHVSGFSQAQDIFDKLAVGEVWLAWTEDPTDPLAKKLRALASIGSAACDTGRSEGVRARAASRREGNTKLQSLQEPPGDL